MDIMGDLFSFQDYMAWNNKIYYYSAAPPEELTTVKRLILPDGMGSSYKVLIQHKGCSPPTLDGLSLRTIPAK